jgi:hypothetical protein
MIGQAPDTVETPIFNLTRQMIYCLHLHWDAGAAHGKCWYRHNAAASRWMSNTDDFGGVTTGVSHQGLRRVFAGACLLSNEQNKQFAESLESFGNDKVGLQAQLRN